MFKRLTRMHLRGGAPAIVGFLMAIAAIAAAAPAYGEGSAIARLERLGESLRRQPAWTAAYHQEYVAAGMTAGEELDGRVWVAWPDFALFHEGDPPVRLMGLEGRSVRLVDLEVPSCDDHELDAEEWARVPLAAVLDPRGALDHFTVLEHGDRGVRLLPREPGGIDRVELEIGAGGLPETVVVVDAQGATNRLQFSGWRGVDGPPDGEWLPPVPDGLVCSED